MLEVVLLTVCILLCLGGCRRLCVTMYVASPLNLLRRLPFILNTLCQRTDFLPIGPDREDEVFERGVESVDSDSEEGCEMAYACGMNKAFMPLSDGEESESERQNCMGNDLLDFQPYLESVGGDC